MIKIKLLKLSTCEPKKVKKEEALPQLEEVGKMYEKRKRKVKDVLYKD